MLLVEAALAAKPLVSLASADRIGIAWDLSTPPDEQLEALLSTMRNEHLTSPAQWSGLLGYFSPDHGTSEEEHSAASAAFSELPFAQVINL